ncbi:MAG TPA: hypothetical protein VIC71_05735 [Gammaproteobacteria bacterium]|jgi:hypothetical protein
MRIRALALVTLLAVTPVAAARFHYLARGERLCDAAELACIYGSLTFHVNTRVLWLRGRLKSSPGPGTFAIRVRGTTRLGYVRYAPVEIELDGHWSEIVDFQMIPDDPDVYNWEIDAIEYVRD